MTSGDLWQVFRWCRADSIVTVYISDDIRIEVIVYDYIVAFEYSIAKKLWFLSALLTQVMYELIGFH